MDNILTTGGSIVGGLINAGANIYMQNQTNRNNRAIANENNRFNREMWNLQTQYNTPANQMQRFKEAGLNTSLMYGTPQNVASSPTPADTTGKAVAPQIQMDSVISNAMQQYNQNKLIDSQKSKLDAEKIGQDIENAKNAITLPYEERKQILGIQSQEQNIELLKTSIQKTAAEISNIGQDTINKQLEGQQLEYNIDYLQKTLQARIQTKVLEWKQAQKNIEVSDATIKSIKAQAYLFSQQALTEQTKRTDILDRLQVFKDLSAEDLKQAKIANEKLEMDMHRYKGLYGTKDDATIYGWIMEVANDMTSMVGKIFSGTSNFSPSKTTNVNHNYGK